MNLEPHTYLKFLLRLRKHLKNSPTAKVGPFLSSPLTIRIQLEAKPYGERSFCPITFLVLCEYGLYFSSQQYQEAAHYTDLDIYTVGNIVNAADGTPGRYRNHLEYFLGKKKEVKNEERQPYMDSTQ